MCNLSIIFCLGLEKNETAPKPVLPEPREPSKKEKEEAVQFLITSTSNVSQISIALSTSILLVHDDRND